MSADTHEKKGFKEAFLRTVAVVGLLAVLLLGAWGVVVLATNLPSLLSSIGTGIPSLFTTTTSEALNVSAPSSIVSGQSMILSWQHTNKDGEYSYSISYSCENGLTVKAPLPTGSYQTVPCDQPFNYVNATEKMTLILSTSKGITATPTFTVSSLKLSSGLRGASGNASVTVNSTSAATGSTGSTGNTQPSSTYVPASGSQTTTLYGYADLRVVINSVNSLSSVQGRTVVQFTIENIGTNVARTGWMFNAQLPTANNSTYTYTAPTQQALYPGDKIVYTLGFDSPYGYNNQVCTLQYPNYNCPSYNYTNPVYNSSYTCGYHYDGYANTYVCGYYDGNGNWVNGYPPQNYNYNYQYNQNYNYQYGTRLVTITADPYGAMYELNRANNTASASVY